MIRFALLSSKWTSANPTFTNTIKPGTIFQQVDLTRDLEEDVKRIVNDLEVRRGPVSIGGDIPGKVTKGLEWLGNTPELGSKKVPKGMLKNILEADLGVSKARGAMTFLINPQASLVSGLASLARGGPLGAAILLAIAAPHMIKAITHKLTQRGSFFDLTFRNIMDTRINVLRTRESQQEIRRGIEGKSQVILTTRAGTVNPIFSWNSYEQINNNELEFEKLKQVRSVFTGP